jgi:TBC domain-containing protein kinase-like protein
LDSVAAPFVVVNFASSDVAYACLQEFVNKHLRNLYRSDNSGVLHEYLAILAHLIVYHDPVLGSHFDEISFHPNLYAIPWLLTLFTHVFPMEKIFNFWDKVLVGPVGLGFFMALSIVLSFRQRLLEADFNDCNLVYT